MSFHLYATFVLACVVILLVPGPNMTMVVANSLSHGTRAGLLNVAGAMLGLLLMLGILLVGLASIVETMGVWFEWVRLLGAAYLVWLGIRLWRSSGETGLERQTATPRGGFVMQGFLVILSNPKALLFLGAFIPQFVDPSRDYLGQVLLLGATFMAVGALFDGFYALLAGRARRLFTRSRVRLAEKLSGSFLIGGGIWLALSRARP